MEKEKGDITPETFTPQVGMESIKAYVLECAHFSEKQSVTSCDIVLVKAGSFP